MPPPRTFDYDVLNRLVRDHPEYSNIQYASIMTQYERDTRHDEHYPMILPNAIARAISQFRARWADEGRPIKPRQYGRLVPWPGLPHASLMAAPMRHIKTLAKLKLNQRVPAKDERLARRFVARLEAGRQIVDIDDQTGKVLIRDARPDELDSSGRLIKPTADVRQAWLDKAGEPDPLDHDVILRLREGEAEGNGRSDRRAG